MTGAVEVVGGQQFARTLRKFGDDLQHLDAAGAEAGGRVLELVQGRARRKTGRLAASFGQHPAENGVEVGSPLNYAGVQEFGWARHGITPSLALTRSLRDAQPAVERIYFGAVDTALGKVRGK